jgi:hypothetical protein
VPLADGFLAQYPLNFTGALGLPLPDTLFILSAGTVELIVGLFILFGIFPREVILVAWLPFNLTLTVFNWLELIGHLPFYGRWRCSWCGRRRTSRSGWRLARRAARRGRAGAGASAEQEVLLEGVGVSCSVGAGTTKIDKNLAGMNSHLFRYSATGAKPSLSQVALALTLMLKRLTSLKSSRCKTLRLPPNSVSTK